MRSWSRFGLSVVACLATFGVATAGDIVTRWNADALQLIRKQRVSPPVASRALAMMHLAILGGVEAAVPTSARASASQLPSNRAAEAAALRDAAGACAAREVLVALFPQDRVFCDQELASILAEIPAGLAKDRGIAAGLRIGTAIVAQRAHDGSADTDPYPGGLGAGQWRPTPPGFLPALLPNWAHVTPFAMTSPSQFSRAGIPALDSDAYAAALDEVRSLGAKDGATRTDEQTEIALFWADGGGTATPPGHWNVIAEQLSALRQLTVEENARLFAVLNVALADAAIAAWEMKYAHGLWRPVTAIQLADTDGNDATDADPDWLPLIATPPFPSYVSGHSTFSGAASAVLARFFGSDNTPFVTTSDGLPGVTRSFGSFSEAAEEAGQSRIYGGIHYQFDNQDGLAAGREIGEWVWRLYGRPVIRR